jgi:LytS/YehU family sensor histidine kinase
LRAQLARAELGALRARLHPHFLFNALHSVGALVRSRENDLAVRVVADLSDLLREVISRDAPELVRLRDELAFVRRYVDIESVRFADRLRVDWRVSDDVRDAVVPSFIMQPLVENAIRHAVSESSNAGHLRISAMRQDSEVAIDIVDDGPGPMSKRTSNGNGIGIADARERLSRLYAERGSLTVSRGPDGGTVASLRLPYRPTFVAS